MLQFCKMSNFLLSTPCRSFSCSRFVSHDKSDAFFNLTVSRLKELLRSKSLPTAGRKSELIARLVSHSENHHIDSSPSPSFSLDSPTLPHDLDTLTVQQLKQQLLALGLSPTGQKPLLISRLRLSFNNCQSSPNQHSEYLRSIEDHQIPSSQDPS